MSRTAAILLAAGRGRRMADQVADKVLAPMGGRPVFAYVVDAFQTSGVADLYVVVYRDQRQLAVLAAHAPAPALLVRGGRDRQDSVMAALTVLPAEVDCVFIHDCARPCVTPQQLTALRRLARREQAVVLAHRVTDTIKERGMRGRLRTLDRDRLWAMETPQVFARGLIVRAYQRVAALGVRVTDDAAAVELLRHPTALLENTRPNPKLTTPADLACIASLLSARQSP